MIICLNTQIDFGFLLMSRLLFIIVIIIFVNDTDVIITIIGLNKVKES